MTPRHHRQLRERRFIDFTAALISERALFNALGFGSTMAQLDLAVCAGQTGSARSPKKCATF